MTRFQQSTISVCVVRRIVSIVQKKRSIYFGSENIFFAPHKNNDKPKIPCAFLGAFLRAWSVGHEK